MSDILIAEDSATQATQIRGLVEAAGFTTRVVGNGVEALRAIVQQAPLAVLSDLDMPEMNGLDLVVAVCREHPAIPVILMTAFGSEEIAIQALQSGAASYVPKKNLVQDLITTLQDVLELVHARREDARLAECLTGVEACFEFPNLGAPVMQIVGYVQDGMARLKLGNETDRLRLGVALNAAIQNSIYFGNLELTPQQLNETRHLADSGKSFDRMVYQRSSVQPYRERVVHIGITMTPTEVRCTIRHEGPGFDLKATLESNEVAELVTDHPSGWLSVKSFVGQVTFNASGNEVTLTNNYRL
jgi:CheY-like chemotaxis protein